MNEELILRDRFSDFFRWERIKKREKRLIAVFLYSILAAILILPAEPFLPAWINPLAFPVLCFLFLTAGVFLRRRWENRDALRALFRLDKTLHLEERSITAWEILNRKEKQPVDLLVLKEAEERLRDVEPRSVLKRRLTWHAFAAPPLFVLWIFLLQWDAGSYFGKSGGAAGPIPLARKVKEYAYGLEERAKSQGLAESLRVARSLKEAAEKKTSDGMSERKLKASLSGLLNQVGKMGAIQGDETDLFFPGLTREGLLDLKAELETLKHLLSFPADAGGQGRLEPELIERLAALPRLKGEFDKGALSVEELGTEGLSRSLRKYEKGVKGELDRRSLQEVEEFLGSLLAGERMFAEEDELGSGFADEGGLFRSAKSRKEGGLPGRHPGREGESSPSSPPFPARAVTHLKGIFGKGKSRSMIVRGESHGEQTGQISEEEIVTSYRRQAEEELASEKIPEGLKETVRRYFLSLGAGPNKPVE
jgi:hypothetical protein